MTSSERWRELQLKHYAPAVEGRTDPPRYKKFLSHLSSPPKKILDAGCASGDITYDLQQRGYKTIGIDYPEVIEKTKIKHPSLMLFGCDLYSCDLNSGVPIHITDVDWVYASEILEHITHDYDFLVSCHECLKPLGRIYLTVPRVGEKWDGHLRYYPVESLRNLLWAAGFKVIHEDKDFSSTIVIGAKEEEG